MFRGIDPDLRRAILLGVARPWGLAACFGWRVMISGMVRDNGRSQVDGVGQRHDRAATVNSRRGSHEELFSVAALAISAVLVASGGNAAADSTWSASVAGSEGGNITGAPTGDGYIDVRVRDTDLGDPSCAKVQRSSGAGWVTVVETCGSSWQTASVYVGGPQATVRVVGNGGTVSASYVIWF